MPKGKRRSASELSIMSARLSTRRFSRCRGIREANERGSQFSTTESDQSFDQVYPTIVRTHRASEPSRTHQQPFSATNMQHLYENNSFSHHESEHYMQPLLRSRYQYQHEQHSLSPQQSPMSDADDVSRPSTHPYAVKIMKKKKQAKKKRKDPNEPQKPVSPYALFFRDTQNDIKKKLANPSFGEISKVVAHMWENIEPELKEQYKHRAAAAKKEYLKQLAAYRAVQVSHQTPNMAHFLNQSALSLHPPAPPRPSKPYPGGSMPIDHPPAASSSSSHSLQQFCSPPSHPPQYNNFHYINSYCPESSHVYPSDHSMFYPQQIYSSYDGHDHLHYGSNRSTGESEHHSSYYSPACIDPAHYTDLTPAMASRSNHRSMDRHYESMQHGPHRSIENKEDEGVFASSSSSSLPIRNENDFHWHSTTCSGTQW